MKKYYIGLAILFVLTLATLGYTIQQGAGAKKDKITSDKFQQIATKLNEANYNGDSVPNSLAAAGITDAPSTITYTKINSGEYKICVNYSQASGIFDAGWSSLFGGANSSSAGVDAQSLSSSSATKSYIDTTVIYDHKKGPSCQTIQPYGGLNIDNSTNSNSGPFTGDTEINPNSLNSGSAGTAACSSAEDSQYEVAGTATISKIDTTAGVITFSTTGQSLKDQAGNAISPPITSEKYDEATVFCDATGKTTTISDFKVDQKVKVFIFSQDSGFVDKIEP